jgi:hypothetical protein
MTDGGFGPPIPSVTDDGWGVFLNPSVSVIRRRIGLLWRVWMTYSIIYDRGTQNFLSTIPLMNPKRNPKFKCGLFFTHTYLVCSVSKQVYGPITCITV